MNNHYLPRLIGVALCAGLAACSTSQDAMKANELSQKTVEYSCGAEAQQPLSVQYTFQGVDPVTAKIIYNNQAIDLARETGGRADMVGNTFSGGGYTWTTGKFNRDTVGQVDGDMLTQQSRQSPNANGMPVNNILAKSCKVRR